jgi:DNA topoisomerase-1
VPKDDKKSIAVAHDAGLRYVRADSPGIRRLGRPGRFRYVAPGGGRVSAADMARIKQLLLPPAWKDVWICPIANGHLQAVGIDARGRKQYRYHAQWRQTRDSNKYDRLLDFINALPTIRRAVRRDLKRKGIVKEKVLAAIVRLLETSFIRVGNDEYARDNKSYGLTTMHNRHARVKGSEIVFRFPGKSGVRHEINLQDRKVARIVRQCQDLPGAELFAYLDEAGNAHDVGSADVNDYLKSITGQSFTAKDFRTWAGTVLMMTELAQSDAPPSETARKKSVVAAIDHVAGQLGNTRAVCRKCYIHLAVVELFMSGGTDPKNHTKKAGKKGSVDAALRALLRRQKRKSARG